MGGVLYFKTVSLGRECSATEEHGPNMSEALRSIFSTIVMKRRRRRCSGSTSRRKYTLIFKLSLGASEEVVTECGTRAFRERKGCERGATDGSLAAGMLLT